MFAAYHGELYKVAEFRHRKEGIWVRFEGLLFWVMAEYVTIFN